MRADALEAAEAARLARVLTASPFVHLVFILLGGAAVVTERPLVVGLVVAWMLVVMMPLMLYQLRGMMKMWAADPTTSFVSVWSFGAWRLALGKEGAAVHARGGVSSWWWPVQRVLNAVLLLGILVAFVVVALLIVGTSG